MNNFFKISERNSSIGREVIGGVTTFFTMAYIVIVNPSILVNAGIPFDACLTATCFAAAITTGLMGIIVNRPIALASGMGLNAMIVGLCVGHDTLFIKHSDAPVTYLIVKDRVLAHNPAGALYQSSMYYRRIMEPGFPSERPR